MKIGVVIKQVPDTASQITLKPDGSGVDCEKFKYVLNPYDEFAVGEAVATRERIAGSELVVFSLGPKRVSKTIRDVLAVGADRGIHIVDDAGAVTDPVSAARLLAAAIKAEDVRLIFAGRQAVDDDLAAVPQMIAEALGMPHATVVSKVQSVDAEKSVVERDVEGGQKEVVELTLPAVISANRGLTKMKLASLLGIRAAAKKEIREVEVGALGVAPSDGIAYRNWQLPPERSGCRFIEGEPAEQAKMLVRLLREEAKVI